MSALKLITFMSDFGTTLLSGAFDLGTSLFNHYLSEEAVEKQFNRQLQFWNKQNDYNSPLAQRQRFNQAGMNPMSATGQMASSGTSQGLSSVPGNEYAQQGALKLTGLASTLETIARIENLGAETGLATEQITSEALRQTLLGLDIKKSRVDYLVKSWEERGKSMEYSQMPEFFRHRNAMYDLDEQYRSAEIKHENALKSLADAQSDESKESARRLVAETGLTQIKADTERSIQSLNEQLKFKTKSETNLNRKEFGFRQITDGFRARALRLANEISASESTIKEIEAVFANIDASMYTNPDGTANWAKYTTEVLEKIKPLLGLF